MLIHEAMVASMPANMLVPYYLMASYLYYHCDRSPMTDQAYDLCCQRLDAEWFWIEHRHKDIIDPNSLAATTGYNLRRTDYPTIVVIAAHGLMDSLAEGRIPSQLSTILNPQEGAIVPNITIATINERLNLGLTAQFIKDELGVEPVETIKKSSLWTEDQFQGDICDKLVAHIERNRRSTATAAPKPGKTAAPAKAETSDDLFTESSAGDDPFADDSANAGDDPFADDSAADAGDDPFGDDPASGENDNPFGD